MNLIDEIGPNLPGIEQLRRMMETGRRAPMAETLDMHLVEVEEGRVVFETTPGVQHYNPMAVVHGGFAATLLDFACGYAVLSRLNPNRGFSTLEIKVAYHRAMKSDTDWSGPKALSCRWDAAPPFPKRA